MATSAVKKTDWKDRSKLLNDLLLVTPKRIHIETDFWNAADPLSWVIIRGLVQDKTTFYSEVSKVYTLPFKADLPLVVNPKETEKPQLSISESAKHLVFHFYENGKSCLAISNPCMSKKTLSDLKELLPKNTKIVFCPHGVIKHALTFYNGYLSAKSAENALSFARPEHASQRILNWKLTAFIIVSVVFFFAGFYFFEDQFVFYVYLVINIFYFVMNPFKILLFIAGKRQQNEVHVSEKEVARYDFSDLPYYTLLIPLKNESSVVPKLLNNLKSLDYPLDKLDIKLAVEVTDTVTLDSLNKEGISNLDANLATPHNMYFHLVKVPEGEISTKPRTCNFALQLARGTITVIYDAEDRPDPAQLKTAWHVLLHEKLNTLCVQGKLTFYNTYQNLLTRFFTLEYGFWFDWFLPGLQALQIPIPLGGTSNHFLTASLKKVGAWDAHNVTEDADLGWRIARYGYDTVVMNSYTYEEAMSSIWGWIKQRTRWQKGFLITSIVHSKDIFTLYKDLGFWKTFSSVLIFSSVVFMPLINPLLWLFFVGWYLLPLLGYDPLYLGTEGWIQTISLWNLFFGNLTYVVIHVLVALKHNKFRLIIPALLTPFYWPLLSLATYRAVWQMITDPAKWEKSEHGLDIR